MTIGCADFDGCPGMMLIMPVPTSDILPQPLIYELIHSWPKSSGATCPTLLNAQDFLRFATPHSILPKPNSIYFPFYNFFISFLITNIIVNSFITLIIKTAHVNSITSLISKTLEKENQSHQPKNVT